MRRTLLVMVLLVTASAALAAPWASTESLASGSVAVTNRQANSVWTLVAVLWKFTAPTNAALTVSRVSLGETFLVSSQNVANAGTAIWIPEAPYPFECWDALLVTSTATNGVVQIIRKGE